MKIGVIGLGMVGEAISYGFKRVGHDVRGFDNDPKKNALQIAPVLDTEVAFVCVPTPCGVTGQCNTMIVEHVVGQLSQHCYQGVVAIKSTVPPGTTMALRDKYPALRLAFCPEFLRERARYSDFVEGHELCIAGVPPDVSATVIFAAHGALPKHCAVMSPTEAELAKYFVNVFNAQRIVFANAFYDVCKTVGADYDRIKEAVFHRADTKSAYMECNENFRAFGGACLPKDTRAFQAFVSSLGLATHIFETIVDENERVRSGFVSTLDIARAAREA